MTFGSVTTSTMQAVWKWNSCHLSFTYMSLGADICSVADLIRRFAESRRPACGRRYDMRWVYIWVTRLGMMDVWDKRHNNKWVNKELGRSTAPGGLAFPFWVGLSAPMYWFKSTQRISAWCGGSRPLILRSLDHVFSLSLLPSLTRIELPFLRPTRYHIQWVIFPSF